MGHYIIYQKYASTCAPYLQEERFLKIESLLEGTRLGGILSP